MDDSIAKKYNATVSQIEDLGSGVKRITFKIEKPFDFIAGQYVWIEIPQIEINDPRGNRRAFSICSSPDIKDTISIIGRISDSGFKKALFALKTQDSVIIHGPFGSLEFPKDTNIPVVCVAGGVGIAPFMSLIPDSLLKDPKRKIVLLYVHSKDDSTLLSFFQELQSKNPEFSVVEVIGRITKELLSDQKSKYSSLKWFIVGPKEMVDFVGMTLDLLGVSKNEVIFEEFYWTKEKSEIKDYIEEMRGDRGIFKLASEQSSNHIIITDPDGYIVFANEAAEKITGYSFSEMKGNTPRLWGGLMTPEFYQNLWHTIKVEKKPFIGKVRNRRKNGQIYYAIIHISPLSGTAGNLLGFMATEEDITREAEIDRAKTEFVSIASHQLRTPLTSIKWFSEMLLSNDLGGLNKEQIDNIKNISDSNQRMIDLVNSLLNISRIESGRLLVDPKPTNVEKLVRDLVVEFTEEIKHKEQKIEINIENLPEINLDPSLIHEVYSNLLRNAIKYTPEKGTIEISLVKKDDQLLSLVKDTGYGILEKDKNRVFTKFFRGENIMKFEPDGTGLGLYLVKSIVESSGGKIWFESVEGKGTSFYFIIPLTGMAKKAGSVTLNP